MKRREILAHSGVLVSIASLGGCLGQYRDFAGDGGETTTQETTTQKSVTTTQKSETTTQKSVTTTPESRPSVTDTSFSITKAGCGSPTNEASVEFEQGGSVAITGTIAGESACYTAKLADVSYDPDADTLDVTVVSTKREGADMCADCITEIEYEATVAFSGGFPATVRVVHGSMGESKTVTTADPS